MSTALFAVLRLALVPLLLVSVLLLPYIGGDPSAYVAILFALLIVIVDFALPRRQNFDPTSAWFLVSFLLLAVVFVITNRPGTLDFLFIVNFIMFALFAPLATGLLRVAGPLNARRVADFALLGTLIALGFALFQVFVEHHSRARGFESSPIRAATAALFLGFLALMGFIQSPGPRRFIYLLGPIMGIVVVYLSRSRGPFLALLPLLAVALLLIPRRRMTGIVVLVAIAVVGTAALFLVPQFFGRLARLPEMIGQVLSGQTVTDGSGNIRDRILQGSLAAFAHSPWVGYGWGAKTAVVDSYLVRKVFGASDSYHLHSDLLDFGVSGGIVGLLSYALLLIGPVVGALRSPRDSQFKSRLYAVLILVVGYVCCGAVNLMIGFELMTTFYVCMVAIVLGYCRDEPLPPRLP